jgi:hypothetical protein
MGSNPISGANMTVDELKAIQKNFTQVALSVLGNHGLATDKASTNRIFMDAIGYGVAEALNLYEEIKSKNALIALEKILGDKDGRT